jgi:hypothetical protein
MWDKEVCRCWIPLWNDHSSEWQSVLTSFVNFAITFPMFCILLKIFSSRNIKTKVPNQFQKYYTANDLVANCFSSCPHDCMLCWPINLSYRGRDVSSKRCNNDYIPLNGKQRLKPHLLDLLTPLSRQRRELWCWLG